MGRMLGSVDSAMCQKTIGFNYTSALVTQKFYVAPSARRVVAIQGVTRVAGSGGACTVSIYKAPSGTAVGSGTLLHSGTFDLVGTADTNQVLSLVPNLDSLTLNAGDSLGFVLTGTATSAVGYFGVTLEPV